MTKDDGSIRVTDRVDVGGYDRFSLSLSLVAHYDYFSIKRPFRFGRDCLVTFAATRRNMTNVNKQKKHTSFLFLVIK
jgi:hypothetical protein